MTVSLLLNSPYEFDIPHEFICPITHEIMKNPLMSRYGQIYERDAILTWLSKHNNLCPLTRQVLTVSDLIRHRSLKARIKKWKKMNSSIVDLSS
jgi:SUMO ligase MMS21 Smc5/6 complex component